MRFARRPITRLLPGLLLAVLSAGADAAVYDLTIDRLPQRIGNQSRTAVAVNGSVPGPTLRWHEGEDVVLRVTNRLQEPTSIHWHGLVLPYSMDGVPGISFAGIPAGSTFSYRFRVAQSGTYWYHGHSGFQEQEGLYGGIVIEPKLTSEPGADRDYLVLLSDWTAENPARIMARLKKQSDYYNFQQRTVFDFFRDLGRDGVEKTLSDRLAWGDMRMDPTDIADVTGATYIFLVNGKDPKTNWTALFRPGERVRLRFVNGSAMTHFDLSIPGLPLRVVQADGQDVEPVTVNELRIATAETYDVIVVPKEDRPYTIFAEAMDRSGHARGTLSPRPGLSAPVPAPRPRELVTLEQMAAAHGGGHGHHAAAGMTEEAHQPSPAADPHAGHAGMGHAAPASGPAPDPDHMGHDTHSMDHAAMAGMDHGGATAGHAGMAGMDGGGAASDHAGMDHGSMTHSPDSTTGAGDSESPAPAGKLTYRMLRSAGHHHDWREPDREIVLNITGNMNRYIWSFDDKKYSEASPIRLRLGERVRFTYVNRTMMNHPIHLHGMWQDLDQGLGPLNPRKHVVNVGPGETVRVEVSADAPGQWAFHCHLLYHMESGMFRKVIVETQPGHADARAH
jgi:CopA family copper-resistance protein